MTSLVNQKREVLNPLTGRIEIIDEIVPQIDGHDFLEHMNNDLAVSQQQNSIGHTLYVDVDTSRVGINLNNPQYKHQFAAMSKKQLRDLSRHVNFFMGEK